MGNVHAKIPSSCAVQYVHFLRFNLQYCFYTGGHTVCAHYENTQRPFGSWGLIHIRCGSEWDLLQSICTWAVFEWGRVKSMLLRKGPLLTCPPMCLHYEIEKGGKLTIVSVWLLTVKTYTLNKLICNFNKLKSKSAFFNQGAHAPCDALRCPQGCLGKIPKNVSKMVYKPDRWIKPAF